MYREGAQVPCAYVLSATVAQRGDGGRGSWRAGNRLPVTTSLTGWRAVKGRGRHVHRLVSWRMKDGMEQEERRGIVREEGGKSDDGVHRWTPSPPVFPERLRPRDWIYAIGATVPRVLRLSRGLLGLGAVDRAADRFRGCRAVGTVDSAAGAENTGGRVGRVGGGDAVASVAAPGADGGQRPVGDRHPGRDLRGVPSGGVSQADADARRAGCREAAERGEEVSGRTGGHGSRRVERAGMDLTATLYFSRTHRRARATRAHIAPDLCRETLPGDPPRLITPRSCHL
eukprot:ctg_94.g55